MRLGCGKDGEVTCIPVLSLSPIVGIFASSFPFHYLFLLDNFFLIRIEES